MALIEQLLAIVRNTFFESIRQPIMLVLLLVATLLLVLANPLAGFTMDDDQRMFLDLGMATVFTCSALLAAFVATSVLTREIDNKTALTVISKPVGRPMFILGKYVGVAAAIGLGSLYMSLVFMIVEMHTVLQTVRDPVHVPVVVFGVSAFLLGIGIGAWCNFFYDKVFGSTVIVLTTPLLALAYLLSMMFSPNFEPQAMAISFKPELWKGLIVLAMATFVITAVAVAASTRLSQVLTLAVTVGVLVAGLMSNWVFGRQIRSLEAVWLERAREAGQVEQTTEVQVIRLSGGGETVENERTVEVATVPLREMAVGNESLRYAASWAGYAILPNFESMYLSDALTQGHRTPPGYVAKSIAYGGCYIVLSLGIATILFQRREVG